MPTEYDVRRLGPGDSAHLTLVADGVFDGEVKMHLADRFLCGNHNVLVVAFDADVVVGMGSAFIYCHPDKEPEMWVNEVGVSPVHRKKGIAGRIMAELESVAIAEGWSECWLLTEADNVAANALYQSLADWKGPKEQVMYEHRLPR